MNYNTLDRVLEQVKPGEEMDALSVYRALEQVPDGRHKRGVRYSVALICSLILLGKLAGMSTPLAIAEWVRLRAEWLRTVLPVTRQSFPCAATYSNVLRAVDAEQVNAALTQSLTRVRASERCGDEPSRLVGQAEREEHVHVALDGKTDAAARWAMSSPIKSRCINRMARLNYKLVYTRCLLLPGDLFDKRLVTAIRSSSTAFVFVIDHWTILLP